MNLDFAAILVIATLVTGGIWALDSWLWAPKRRVATAGAGDVGASVEAAGAQSADSNKEPIIVEYAKAFFPVILIVLLLRSFLVEPFRIPSGSMVPTLLSGDFILVNKFTYGIRLPVLNSKIISLGGPSRGDVVVFRYPKDPSTDYIKRVIGLPGDRISYHNKLVYVNGEPMQQELLGTYIGEGSALTETGSNLRVEHLGDVTHQILARSERQAQDHEVTVPPGHYFVMGDNRDNSNDSRFWGFVPDKNLVGRAFMIWMNFDPADKGVGVRWSRLGTIIK